MYQAREKGFTLVEVMIVVAILGILAGIGIPMYTGYVQRARLAEAHSHLADLRVKMEQFFQDNRTYVGGPCSPAGTAASQVQFFAFSCPVAATATAYSIRARATHPNILGIDFFIDQSNTRSTTVNAGTKAAQDGFTSQANCWVRRQGSSGVC
jgi:type IV pilus assembly protein PilE